MILRKSSFPANTMKEMFNYIMLSYKDAQVESTALLMMKFGKAILMSTSFQLPKPMILVTTKMMLLLKAL